MLQSITELSAQKSSLYDIYLHHNKKTHGNELYASALYEKLNKVKNTPYNRVHSSAHASKDAATSNKIDLLACLLVWKTLITGVQKYTPSTDIGINNNADAFNTSNPDHKKNNHHANTEKHNQDVATKMATENHKQALPKQPASNVMEGLAVAHSAHCPPAASNNKYPHDSQRNIYYETVSKNILFPLGREIYEALDEFCQSEIKSIVDKAFNADLNTRHELLSYIIDKISNYKLSQDNLREINVNKKHLSPKEHAEEIIIRRKLIVLYLAAESVIRNNSASYFHMIATSDLRNYSDKMLIQKENNIMRYASGNDVMNED